MIDAKGMFRVYVVAVGVTAVAIGAIAWLAFYAVCAVLTHFMNCGRSAETRYGLTNAQERVQAPQEPQEKRPTNTLTGPQEAALERILDGKHDK